MNEIKFVNTLAKQIYQINKDVGWWDDIDRCIFETIQLASSEVGEGTNGDRKNLMDDKLPHRKMLEVELADTLIRILDIGGRYKFNYIDGLKYYYDDDLLIKIKSTAGKLLMINKKLIELANVIILNSETFYPLVLEDNEHINFNYTETINCILKVGDILGLDVVGAMYEKIEFNKTREDHKRENRQKENGKKY